MVAALRHEQARLSSGKSDRRRRIPTVKDRIRQEKLRQSQKANKHEQERQAQHQDQQHCQQQQEEPISVRSPYQHEAEVASPDHDYMHHDVLDIDADDESIDADEQRASLMSLSPAHDALPDSYNEEVECMLQAYANPDDMTETETDSDGDDDRHKETNLDATAAAHSASRFSYQLTDGAIRVDNRCSRHILPAAVPSLPLIIENPRIRRPYKCVGVANATRRLISSRHQSFTVTALSTTVTRVSIVVGSAVNRL